MTNRTKKSVRFLQDATAKHGVFCDVLEADDRGALTLQERLLGWYNGRNYQLFKTLRRNQAIDVRQNELHSDYRQLFGKVLAACDTSSCQNDVTGGGGWIGDSTEVAAKHYQTATKSALILSQSRYRGLERTIFPELLLCKRQAAIQAVLAVAKQMTLSCNLSNSERDEAIRAVSVRHSLCFGRFARLSAMGDALLITIWDRIASKMAAAEAALMAARPADAAIATPANVECSDNNSSAACKKQDEEPTESTVDSDDDDDSDNSDDFDSPENDSTDIATKTLHTSLQSTLVLSRSSSPHNSSSSSSSSSTIGGTVATKKVTLMKTRCSLMA